MYLLYPCCISKQFYCYWDEIRLRLGTSFVACLGLKMGQQCFSLITDKKTNLGNKVHLSVPSTTLQIFFVHTWVYCDCVCVCVCVCVCMSFMSPHMYLCQHRCVSFVPPFICVCTCVSYVLTWPRHPGTFQRLGFSAGLSRPFSLPMQSH